MRQDGWILFAVLCASTLVCQPPLRRVATAFSASTFSYPIEVRLGALVSTG